MMKPSPTSPATFRFMADNAPGTIYVGTRRQFEGLALDGYAPSPVSDHFTGAGWDGPDAPAWPVEAAPAFWADLYQEHVNECVDVALRINARVDEAARCLACQERHCDDCAYDGPTLYDGRE